VGGTSLSAPLALGVWARIESHYGNGIGYAAPVLYDVYMAGSCQTDATTLEYICSTPAFHAPVAGDSEPYPETPGYNYDTGLGTFDTKTIIQAIQPSPAARTGCSTDAASRGQPPSGLAIPGDNGAAPVSVTAPLSFEPSSLGQASIARRFPTRDAARDRDKPPSKDGDHLPFESGRVIGLKDSGLSVGCLPQEPAILGRTRPRLPGDRGSWHAGMDAGGGVPRGARD
jgi:hypothetical protein